MNGFEINPDDVGYYIATPYPGTPMYDYVVKKGWLKIFDFDKYDTATPTFESPTMGMKELKAILLESFHPLLSLAKPSTHNIRSDKHT